MKKLLMILLAAALVCGIFSGCAAKTEPQQTEEPQPETTVFTEPVTYSEDTEVENAEYHSTGKDENAILIEDGAVSLTDVSVERVSDDSTGGDNASFYGVGAAVLAKGGETTIENAEITTDSKGGAGVFAYGDGVVTVKNSTISTKQDTSGGVHVAGGGTLYAANVTAETDGGSSAAIRSDRGGGLLVAEGGSYTSNGSGSPAIYSTATIVVKDADLTATGSEAVCIEGANGVYLYDCNLSGDMPDLEQNDCTWNVILYQSMSGDSAVGNSTFQMEGGTLTASNGGMFYTTNTESTILLKDVEILAAEDAEFLLKCTGNANKRTWGKTGANGADCTFLAASQELSGDVLWDSVSNLKLYLTQGSTLTGAILQDEVCAGDGGDGTAMLTIDADCTWIVTADSVVTAINSAGKIVDEAGKTVTVKTPDGTVLKQGESDLTVTAQAYSETVDVSYAEAFVSFEDAQVNNGSQESGPMTGATPPEMSDGQQPPEMPDGQQPPEMPDGQQPPEMPNGQQHPEMSDGQQPPEKPAGEPNSGV